MKMNGWLEKYERRKKAKGVTMVTLVITIVIILLLTGVILVTSLNTIEEADYSKYVANVSDVSTAFKETSTSVNGEKVAEQKEKNEQQVYNYVAKDGKGESDFLILNEVPEYTVLKDAEQIGIKLPQMTVESGTGKRVPVSYATTKGGQIFTWPPYDYDDKYYITNKDTVESKMQTDITVGDESFKIEIDPIYGTLKDVVESIPTPPEQNPDIPETPDVPERPENPETPDEPDNPEAPETPEVHVHDFSSEVATTAYLANKATCTAPASYYYKCTGCSEKGTNTYTSGNALGHDFSVKNTNNEYLVSGATCTEAAKYHYKCSRCDTKGTEIFIEGNALGHNFGEFEETKSANCMETGLKKRTCTRCSVFETEVIEKNENNHIGETEIKTEKQATCTETGIERTYCKSCGAVISEKILETLGHNFTDKTQTKEYLKSEATCTKAAVYYYKCSRCAEKGTETYTVGNALGHTYGEPIFNWSADYTSVTVTFKCNSSDDTKTLAAKVTIEITKEATCEEVGERTFTATVEFEGKTYTDVRTQVIEAKGHTYGDPTMKWSEDFTSADAEFVCSCGKVHTVVAEVVVNTKDPTCEEEGKKDYTANITWGDKNYTYVETERIPATGHTGSTKFEWSEDYSSAVAIFSCTCGEREVVNATVNSGLSVEPTCTQTGKQTYTATVVFFEEVYTEQKTVTIAALGHAYTGEPVFNWSADYETVSARMACVHGDATKDISVNVRKIVNKEATCNQEGLIKYVAELNINEEVYTETKEVVTPVLEHVFSAKLPTSTYLVNVATCTEKAEYYYKCLTCSEKGQATYKNGEALGHEFKEEIIDNAHLASEATCMKLATYFFDCTRCDEIGTETFEAGELLEHEFEGPIFTWAEDNKSATAKVICAEGDGEQEVEVTMSDKIVVYAGCETEGTRRYTATVVINGVEHSEYKDTRIAPYNHPQTEIRDETEHYTGDLVCTFCGKVIQKGNGTLIQALHLEDDSLVFVNRLKIYESGETFEGLNIKEVYTGMDTQHSLGFDSTPWDTELEEAIKKVVIKDEMTPETTQFWFRGFKNCTEFDLAKLDISNVKSLESMFDSCQKVTSLDLSGWDTTNVTSMREIFKDCKNLISIKGLADWNTSNVTEMYGMFYNCKSMETIEGISGWNTSKAEYMTRIFYGMSNLRELDLSNWRTARVTAYMFDGCVRLEKITVGSTFYFHDDAYLPEPDKNYIPEIIGEWFVLDEVTNQTAYYMGYDPENVPSGKAATYVCAVYDIDYNNWSGATFANSGQRTLFYSKYSSDMIIKNPEKEGSDFLGWTGNGITTPTTSMVIPSGTTGRLTFVANWKLRYTPPTGKRNTFDGTSKVLLSKGNATIGTMYFRLGENGTWSTEWPTAVNAGEYDIYYYVTAAGGYEETEVLGPVTGIIEKARGELTKAPTALELEYNGSEQTLVEPGTSNTGELKYRIGTSGSWNITLPTARYPGEYDIYYYVETSNNYEKTEVQGPITAIINKGIGEVTTHPVGLELRYNGEAQELVTEGYSRTGSLRYRIGTSDEWTSSLPTAIDGGEYEIYYYAAESSNYLASEVMGPIIAKINGFAGQITPPGALELIYNGEEQVLVTPVTSATGTVYYKVGGTGEWSTELPKATNVGTYRVYYYAAENGDYSETSRFAYVTSIIKKDGADTPEIENNTVVFNQPYVLSIGSIYIDLIFREDGTIEGWMADEEGSIIPAEYVTIEDGKVTIVMSETETVEIIVSEGGSQLTVPLEVDGEKVELKLNLTPVEPQSIRFGQEYIAEPGDGNIYKMILNEDGSAKTYLNDSSGDILTGSILYNEHYFELEGAKNPIYPDGSKIMADGIIFTVKENVIHFGEKYSTVLEGVKTSIILYEDGSCDIFENDEFLENMPAGSLQYTYNTIIVPPNDFMGNTETLELPLSRDGIQIILETEDGIINIGLILESETTSVEMDGWYVAVMEGEEQGFLVPHADGSIDSYDLNYTFIENISNGVVYGENNYVNFMGLIATASVDGKTITMIPTIFECKLIKNDTPNLPNSPIICNQPYRIGTETENEEIIFRENGTVELWSTMGKGCVIPAEDVIVDGINVSINFDGNTFTGTASESGDIITLNEGIELKLTRLIQKDIVFDQLYIYSDGTNEIEGTISANGSAILSCNGYITEIPAGGTIFNNHSLTANGMEIQIYPDGSKVMFNNFILTTSEYAIRFGEPYSMSFLETKFTVKFYKDGSYELTENGETQQFAAGTFEYTKNQIIFSEEQTDGIAGWSKTYTFSKDGAKATMDDMEQEFEMGFVLESTTIAIKFGEAYASVEEDGTITGYIVFYEDGSSDEYGTDLKYQKTSQNGIIYGKNNYVNMVLGSIGRVSADGSEIVVPGALNKLVLSDVELTKE